MTLAELIERLEEAAEAFGGDAEVRLMMQQNWPFEYSIGGVTSLEEIRRQGDEEDFDCEGDAESVLYLVEGRQLGYGTPVAWNICH